MSYRNRFPMLLNNDIVYLDNAALSQKPDIVCQAGNDFYTKYCISTRTKDSKLGYQISEVVEQTRKKIASLLDANYKNVIFYSGTTEALNQCAMMISDLIEDGDEILISVYNHASNILPYFYFFEKIKDVKITYFDSQQDLMNKISSKTRVIALSQVTNNVNEHYDMEQIYQKCLKNDIILVNDAAQAITHKKVTIKNSDFIAFSANKLYGPTGLGSLVISDRVFQKIRPKKFGGGSAKSFRNENYDFDYSAYESGTLNLAGIYQFNKSLDFIEEISLEAIEKEVNELSYYLHDEIAKVQNVIVYSKPGDAICLFNVKNVASQDVASYLGNNDIYVRSGTFCGYLLTETKYNGTMVRASLSFYNSKEDIDKLCHALKKGGDFLDFL
ncbi:cysteine desulfurase [[Mycoplasma] gypis]|uniref:Aminotransferase class V-fold PLP-dependent enzyme n=1 Tax=[Mycoplasma] gypis TaxID=92404 RepID=A0ABZ2RNZ3_9BACT|nr:aminotransferase class V-fold PLP-dependent enzyme [[Mycoplasma] gypis]MBN0919163.1 aminotransferase class V-fold PLP-dependent enzyme [[Mycoplasma] gypis]